MKTHAEVEALYKEAIDESKWPRPRSQRWGIAQGARILALQEILDLDLYGRALDLRKEAHRGTS